jgi:hypothetical protein
MHDADAIPVTPVSRIAMFQTTDKPSSELPRRNLLKIVVPPLSGIHTETDGLSWTNARGIGTLPGYISVPEFHSNCIRDSQNAAVRLDPEFSNAEELLDSGNELLQGISLGTVLGTFCECFPEL